MIGEKVTFSGYVVHVNTNPNGSHFGPETCIDEEANVLLRIDNETFSLQLDPHRYCKQADGGFSYTKIFTDAGVHRAYAKLVEVSADNNPGLGLYVKWSCKTNYGCNSDRYNITVINT